MFLNVRGNLRLRKFGNCVCSRQPLIYSLCGRSHDRLLKLTIQGALCCCAMCLELQRRRRRGQQRKISLVDKCQSSANNIRPPQANVLARQKESLTSESKQIRTETTTLANTRRFERADFHTQRQTFTNRRHISKPNLHRQA